MTSKIQQDASGLLFPADAPLPKQVMLPPGSVGGTFPGRVRITLNPGVQYDVDLDGTNRKALSASFARRLLEDGRVIAVPGASLPAPTPVKPAASDPS